jgi:putative AbiEi antitoxin of type IV toxin-antitoxin system
MNRPLPAVPVHRHGVFTTAEALRAGWSESALAHAVRRDRLVRVDFYWDEFGVAGEVDGLSKYREDPLQTTMRERRRQGLMDELGLIFVRWGRADLHDMRMLTGRVEAALARGSRRPRSDRGWIARFAPQTCALAA